jgi:hypothetical protein
MRVHGDAEVAAIQLRHAKADEFEQGWLKAAGGVDGVFERGLCCEGFRGEFLVVEFAVGHILSDAVKHGEDAAHS